MNWDEMIKYIKREKNKSINSTTNYILYPFETSSTTSFRVLTDFNIFFWR